MSSFGWLAQQLSSRPWHSGIWRDIPVSKNMDALCFLYSAVPPPFWGSSVTPCMLHSNMVFWQQPTALPVKGEELMRGRFWYGDSSLCCLLEYIPKCIEALPTNTPCHVTTALILILMRVHAGIAVKLVQGDGLALYSSGWVPRKAAPATGTPELCA